MRATDLGFGLATGIGSLPHCDPQAAVDFSLEQQPRLPAAPSLPNRSACESMIGQAAWGIPGVRVLDDGSLQLDHAVLDADAPLTDPGIGGEPYLGLRTFLAAVADRTKPIKLQLTGPLTLGLALHRAGASAPTAFAVARAAVAQRADSILRAAECVAPHAPLVVFVDEPGLASAVHAGFPLTANESIDLVSGALATIEPRAVTGLHCCGSADWRAVLQAGPQILSLPVDAGASEHAGALASFLDGGGVIAWGAVPTDGPIGSSADRLWKRLSAVWCELVQGGCDPVLLRERALITPACGLAIHGLPQAEQVMTLANEVARHLENQTLGMRLTVGA
jgi:methionine synthase II (cobalamin-independent)